ncbi:hypothetical protein CVD25_21710 [Bacillus canaveralius]|uniref:Uncharacterized protein n=1 Tax=Bacillus canaveralius TaxID=1403243 RepID=A0A2N5GIA2_9BACI|nr:MULTISPECIES: hypothetical protein [Bacillus]PLR80691.1 hypothetical protein CU635_17560 [Bacillus canaveralius]PLR83857.1 hypothetical protein CVD23_13340 [Bacillus sp. V33-4]PLR89108.1 hypothetical protein CVD25_21710 [Bacillus canaveralius]RSK48170.1 hypothetical protein EJA13_16900 [Bacillus canaveralius]
MQNQQQIWLPLLASAGIGAAAFYSMTRGQGMGQTIQQFLPLAAGMGNNGQQMQQNTQQNQQNQQNQQKTKQNQSSFN